MSHAARKCPFCGKPIGPWVIFTAVVHWGGMLSKVVMAAQGKPVRYRPDPHLMRKCALCGQHR